MARRPTDSHGRSTRPEPMLLPRSAAIRSSKPLGISSMNTSRSLRPLHVVAAVAVLAGAFAVAGCGEGGNNSQPSSVPSVPGGSPSPNPNLLEPGIGNAYLGIYVNPTQTSSPPPSLLSGFEQALGRTMAIAPHYYSFYH